MENMHPLADWLNKTGEPRSAFARKIEISEPHLSLIISRKRGASLELAARIETATKGKVRAVELRKEAAE